MQGISGFFNPRTYKHKPAIKQEAARPVVATLESFLDGECTAQAQRDLETGRSHRRRPLLKMDQLVREDDRLLGEMGKVVSQGRQPGASQAEMAKTLTRELESIIEQGYNEGQVGQKLLDASTTVSHGSCISLRTEGVIVEGKEVMAGALLQNKGHALLSEKQRWYALGQRLQGSFQFTDHVPHEGGLIDRLEKGKTTCKQAAEEIDKTLRKGYSPFGAEAFEGVSPRAGLGFLRKVFGEENYRTALHPEGIIVDMQKYLMNLEITIPKGANGICTTSPDAVRELLANGEPLPEGVTVKPKPSLQRLATEFTEWVNLRLFSHFSGRPGSKGNSDGGCG